MFFRLEFQPIERALLYNTRNRTKTIGFQHSALSKNFLNYVFLKNEFNIDVNNKSDHNFMPLPDNIMTSGRIGYQYMEDSGFPNKKLSICGGLRYLDLSSNLLILPSKSELRSTYNIANYKKIIFFPTTALISETISIINMLIMTIKKLKD